MDTNVKYPAILAACVQRVTPGYEIASDAVELYRQVLQQHARVFHERDEEIQRDEQFISDFMKKLSRSV